MGLFEKIEMTVENGGTDAWVVLSAVGGIDRGAARLRGKLVCNGADNQRPWDLTINAKDLADAGRATYTKHTLFSVCDRGLLIQSEGSEDKFETFLLGCERQ